jgi:RHS repeat-associated protein
LVRHRAYLPVVLRGISANSLHAHINAPQTSLACDASQSYTRKYYRFNGQRIAMRTVYRDGCSELVYLYGDHLGSNSLAIDSSGTKLWDAAYTPFGTLRPGTTGNTAPTDRLFTNQRQENANFVGNVYDYNARLYLPTLGRFMSADSIVPSPSKPQSLNRYSYVGNTPLTLVDPSGHCGKKLDGSQLCPFGSDTLFSALTVEAPKTDLRADIFKTVLLPPLPKPNRPEGPMTQAQAVCGKNIECAMLIDNPGGYLAWTGPTMALTLIALSPSLAIPIVDGLIGTGVKTVDTSATENRLPSRVEVASAFTGNMLSRRLDESLAASSVPDPYIRGAFTGAANGYTQATIQLVAGDHNLIKHSQNIGFHTLYGMSINPFTGYLLRSNGIEDAIVRSAIQKAIKADLRHSADAAIYAANSAITDAFERRR